MITSDRRLVEPKGVDPFEVLDCTRIIMTSNEDWVVLASHDERRWAVFGVSAARRGDRAYSDALVAEMNGAGPAALLHALLTFDLTTVNVWEAPLDGGAVRAETPQPETFGELRQSRTVQWQIPRCEGPTTSGCGRPTFPNRIGRRRLGRPNSGMPT